MTDDELAAVMAELREAAKEGVPCLRSLLAVATRYDIITKDGRTIPLLRRLADAVEQAAR